MASIINKMVHWLEQLYFFNIEKRIAFITMGITFLFPIAFIGLIMGVVISSYSYYAGMLLFIFILMIVAVVVDRSNTYLRFCEYWLRIHKIIIDNECNKYGALFQFKPVYDSLGRLFNAPDTVFFLKKKEGFTQKDIFRSLLKNELEYIKTKLEIKDEYKKFTWEELQEVLCDHIINIYFEFIENKNLVAYVNDIESSALKALHLSPSSHDLVKNKYFTPFLEEFFVFEQKTDYGTRLIIDIKDNLHELAKQTDWVETDPQTYPHSIQEIILPIIEFSDGKISYSLFEDQYLLKKEAFKQGNYIYTALGFCAFFMFLGVLVETSVEFFVEKYIKNVPNQAFFVTVLYFFILIPLIIRYLPDKVKTTFRSRNRFVYDQVFSLKNFIATMTKKSEDEDSEEQSIDLSRKIEE